MLITGTALHRSDDPPEVFDPLTGGSILLPTAINPSASAILVGLLDGRVIFFEPGSSSA